jgi:predicted chitinase
MYNDGVANKYFFMGDDSSNGYKYGLVNIAAFLAQSMKETIQYNACDENSWDLVNGKYPLSNACGQLGQSYQDYQCSAAEAHMACTVNPNMEIKATTNAKWYGAPGPLFCGPKAKYPFTGIWDYTKECNKPWANPPEFCDEYEGQKAGGYDNTSPQANSLGRTDVEGCCFWGRGVIQTTGVCNFGKLNYYLGQRAADEGRASRYPDINFCEQPNAICDSEEHKELKWIAGMFYWVEELQSYNVGGWNYITELKKFVDGGMQDGNSFINAVSGIVNRGCHNPPCAAGPVDGESDRSSNFLKVMKEFKLVA